jgi:hypothetical protein
MKYTEFVKANYSKVANLPAKQRMAKLGQMWRASGHSAGKGVAGGNVVGGDPSGGMFIKRKGGKRGKKRVRGKGIISDTLGAFGLGMPEESEQGSGLISDTLGAFGLGMNKNRKSKGKGVSGGDVAGSGIFSGILGSIGLGVPDNIKRKHYNRMITLEKKLHSNGKLPLASHNKLKVYHTLHGAGFFDSLWSGIKKGASAVASVVPTVASVIPKAVTALPQVLKVVPEALKFVPSLAGLPGVGQIAKLAPLAAAML